MGTEIVDFVFSFEFLLWLLFALGLLTMMGLIAYFQAFLFSSLVSRHLLALQAEYPPAEVLPPVLGHYTDGAHREEDYTIVHQYA